jgi:hypothetical protein
VPAKSVPAKSVPANAVRELPHMGTHAKAQPNAAATIEHWLLRAKTDWRKFEDVKAASQRARSIAYLVGYLRPRCNIRLAVAA